MTAAARSMPFRYTNRLMMTTLTVKEGDQGQSMEAIDKIRCQQHNPYVLWFPRDTFELNGSGVNRVVSTALGITVTVVCVKPTRFTRLSRLLNTEGHAITATPPDAERKEGGGEEEGHARVR